MVYSGVGAGVMYMGHDSSMKHGLQRGRGWRDQALVQTLIIHTQVETRVRIRFTVRVRGMGRVNGLPGTVD